MDKISLYQHAILDILNEYAGYIPVGIKDPRNQVIADQEKHHYLLLRFGWDKGEVFLHHVIMHFDIENDKVWIRANGTELDVGEALVARGVPKEDIVVGFQPERYRAYSGYAVR
jgi:hypothetical protein